jgi:hypothetical protein
MDARQVLYRRERSERADFIYREKYMLTPFAAKQRSLYFRYSRSTILRSPAIFRLGKNPAEQLQYEEEDQNRNDDPAQPGFPAR